MFGWIVVILFFALWWWLGDSKSEQQKKNEQARINQYKSLNDTLDKIWNDVGCGDPLSNTQLVSVLQCPFANTEVFFPYRLWIKDDSLFLFPDAVQGLSQYNTPYFIDRSDIKLTQIPINQIIYYRENGSVYTTVESTGGDIEFSCVTGITIDPIKVNTNIHDERVTQLFYKNGQINCVLSLNREAIYVLNNLLPQKNYNYVNKTNISSGGATVAERLTNLKNLHEQKLITDEEYAAKKNDIMQSL